MANLLCSKELFGVSGISTRCIALSCGFQSNQFTISKLAFIILKLCCRESVMTVDNFNCSWST